jgi:predicted DNA-binding ArsR family transcriptional regulator
MRSKLSVLENEGFLLRRDVDIENLYMYLKKNHKAAQFIYQKYANVREVLKEICNPRNPLYIEAVANELKDLVELSDLKEDFEALNRERSNLRNQLNDLKKELGEKNKELDSLEAKVPELTKQIDDMHKVFGNLSQEETISRIKSFYESVGTFVNGVLESRKKEPISESFNSARLDLNQLNVLRMLQMTAKADLDFILNQDLLSEKNLDAKWKEIKEKMEKEMAEGETSMLAFTEHNPLKTLNKALKGIDCAKEQLEVAGDFSPESGWYYHIHLIPNIQRILDIPKDLLENLIQQVNNVNARKGGKP